MVTYEPGVSHERRRRRRASSRAPSSSRSTSSTSCRRGARGYATCGDDDARAFAGHPPRDLDRARALFVNRREALRDHRRRTRRRRPPSGSARDVEIVVVTLGPEGAMALVDGELVRAPGFEMKAVDTTGAGDLLCAAFVWADLAGADVETCLALGGAVRITLGHRAHGRRRRGHAGAADGGRLDPRPAAARHRKGDTDMSTRLLALARGTSPRSSRAAARRAATPATTPRRPRRARRTRPRSTSPRPATSR